MISIVVLGEPEPWRVTQGRNGRIYPKKSVVDFQRAIATEARAVMRDRPLFKEAVDIRLSVYLPIPSSWSARKRTRAILGHLRPDVRPDLTNMLKAVEDACTGVVWDDDKRVCDQATGKFYAEKPRIELDIFTCGGE